MIYPLYVCNIETYMPIAVSGKKLKMCFVSICIKISLCFKPLLFLLTENYKQTF